MEEFVDEYEMFDEVFKDIGEISGLTILDAGPEGVASRYLAERIGEGRVVGINIWLEAYNMVRERVGDELMSKVVFIKDNMTHMDYVKDDFFDLVFSYDTLIAIETMTPGQTLSILKQFYRILKPGGLFLAVEHHALGDVKPTSKAQELELEFRMLLAEVNGEDFAKGTYTPEQLSEMLESEGFRSIYWTTMGKEILATPKEATGMIEGLMSRAKERIHSDKAKRKVLRQIKDLANRAKEVGFCEPPYYALYARKP